jgi:hypothetical protein
MGKGRNGLHQAPISFSSGVIEYIENTRFQERTIFSKVFHSKDNGVTSAAQRNASCVVLRL